MISNNRPLRIGIATDGLLERTVNGEVRIANGGVGVYIYNLVKKLQEIDSRNEYFLIRYGPGQLDIYQGARTHNVFLKNSLWRELQSPLDLQHRRIAADLKLDLLHYPNQFGGGFLPRTIRRVVTLHDVTPLIFPQFHPPQRVFGYRLLMRHALRNANRIIVDSVSTGRDLVERGVAPEAQVTAIPLAPAARFRPCVRSAGFAERFDLPEPFILTVGVLEPRKNHVALFEALRLLHNSGEKVGLVIAGRPGWRWENPLDDSANSELLPFVRIRADVSDNDLVELYNRAVIFAYPSFYEGFGLPVLEAMACGTAVVTSNTSSLPEVAGDAALFADPKDPQSIATQLKKLLSDRNLRETMQTKGIEHARQFSWRQCAERTLAVYESVCDASLS